MTLGFLAQYASERTVLSSIDRNLRERALMILGNAPPPGQGGPLGPNPFEPDFGGRDDPQPFQPRNGQGPGGPPPNRLESVFAPVMLHRVREGERNPPKPYDAQAAKLAWEGQEALSTVKREKETIRVFSGPRRIDGRIVEVIQTAYPIDEAMRSLRNLRVAMLGIVLPAGLILAALAAFLLVERLLSPLRRMSREAARIGGSTSSERLQVVGADEFADLAQTLNDMLTRLDASLNQEAESRRRLEVAVELQRRFTADASHEMKTPLSVIKANAGLLTQSDLPGAITDSAVEIDHAATRLASLVRDLLALEKIDSAAQPVKIPVDLRETLREAIKSVPDPDRRIRLGEGEAVVMGNVSDLVRLTSNLLENALKHGQGEVLVEFTQDETDVELCVTDKGPGIAPEHLTHIFDRFYRADESRSRDTGGSGLGLAICKGIAESLGGSISVESSSLGTAFRVRLPRPQETD